MYLSGNTFEAPIEVEGYAQKGDDIQIICYYKKSGARLYHLYNRSENEEREIKHSLVKTIAIELQEETRKMLEKRKATK
jgi:hypothetical protein